MILLIKWYFPYIHNIPKCVNNIKKYLDSQICVSKCILQIISGCIDFTLIIRSGETYFCWWMGLISCTYWCMYMVWAGYIISSTYNQIALTVSPELAGRGKSYSSALRSYCCSGSWGDTTTQTINTEQEDLHTNVIFTASRRFTRLQISRLLRIGTKQHFLWTLTSEGSLRHCIYMFAFAGNFI